MERALQKQRVAVYCRVADGGDPVNGCAAQEAYCTELVSQHPDWELMGIYADKGIAAADRRGRREFSRMLSACKRGKIDIIVTKSVSRFDRNVRYCMETVRVLKASGVRVIFEKEQIDTGEVAGDIALSIYRELARMESESITNNFIYPTNLMCSSGLKG